MSGVLLAAEFAVIAPLRGPRQWAAKGPAPARCRFPAGQDCVPRLSQDERRPEIGKCVSPTRAVVNPHWESKLTYQSRPGNFLGICSGDLHAGVVANDISDDSGHHGQAIYCASGRAKDGRTLGAALLAKLLFWIVTVAGRVFEDAAPQVPRRVTIESVTGRS